MRLFDLQLKNIGPFKEASLTFIGENDDQKRPPIMIITGENGTGKTIILDAIRALLLGPYNSTGLDRDILRNRLLFELMLTISFRGKVEAVKSTGSFSGKRIDTNTHELNLAFVETDDNITDNQKGFNWVIDYWTSKLAKDSFEIKNIVSPDPTKYLVGALSGTHQNIEVTQLICFFDYLRGSDSKAEKKVGEYLFNTKK